MVITPLASKQSTARITEDVPGPQNIKAANFVRMSPQDTPSGFRVPRYVSLKYSSSNGRTGPTSGHPVAWRYSRKGMPMIVVAETEIWRKVRDVNGDETWMNRICLTGGVWCWRARILCCGPSRNLIPKKPRSRPKARCCALKAVTILAGAKYARDAAKSLVTPCKPLLWGAEPL